MSRYENSRGSTQKERDKTAAVVCGGTGSVMQKFELALQSRDIYVFKDHSSNTLLSQLDASEEIPESFFRSLVDMYTYFMDISVQGKNSFNEPEQRNHEF